MFISPPGRPRTTSSLKSPRGVAVKLPNSSQEGKKKRIAMAKPPVGIERSHVKERQQDSSKALYEDQGVVILKTEMIHYGSKVKFCIREYSPPANFFAVQLKVVASGQKWSVFVPIKSSTEELLRMWRIVKMEDFNKKSLGSWIIQFTKIVFGKNGEIEDVLFDHNALHELSKNEKYKLRVAMSIRIQRCIRRFIHLKRIQRRSGSYWLDTFSTEQKRSKAQGPSFHRPGTATLPSKEFSDRDDSIRSISADGQPLERLKVRPFNKAAPDVVLDTPNFETVTKYASRPKSTKSSRSSTPSSAHFFLRTPVNTNPIQSQNSDSMMFPTSFAHSELGKKDKGIAGLKFDIRAPFEDGYTPEQSNSEIILQGSEEFPSLPSTSEDSRAHHKYIKKRNKRNTNEPESCDGDDRQESGDPTINDEALTFSVDYGFTPTVPHLNGTGHNLETPNDLAMLFDQSLISGKPGDTAVKKSKGKKTSKKPKSASKPPKSADKADKDSNKFSAPSPHRRNVIKHSLTKRKESPHPSSVTKKNGYTPHIPMAKRATTIKEEREVRRLEAEIEDMKKEVTSLRRKVRFRDRKIREITPIYLQPKNEKYRIAAEILQPIIRSYQKKKFFREKSLELHESLRVATDGSFVREALEIAYASGNVDMAVDAMKRSFEVVSALRDSKHNWHGIKFVPTNATDIRLICNVILSFVSIEEVTRFGLQLLSLVASLQNFMEPFEVIGSAGACEVVTVCLARYCEDSVTCSNALKLCQKLIRFSMNNRQLCVSILQCRAFCTVLLRQIDTISVLEKTLRIIRCLCTDVDDSIDIFRDIGMVDNLTFCMRTYKRTSIFVDICKIITTICCKVDRSASIRADIGTRANCLAYVDGLVSNQFEERSYRVVAVMIVCICEGSKENYENMVTDHLITCLLEIIHGNNTSWTTKKVSFNLVYNLMRICPEEKSTRKTYHKLENILRLESDDPDERQDDSSTAHLLHTSFTEKEIHDSFLDIGMSTVREESLLGASESETASALGHSKFAYSGQAIEEGSVFVDNDSQLNREEGSTCGDENETKNFEDATDLQRDENVEDVPPSRGDDDESIDPSILGVVRNIRESVLALFDDVSNQLELKSRSDKSLLQDVEKILLMISYSEHFKTIFDTLDVSGSKKVEMCVAFCLAFVLKSSLATSAVLGACLLLLEHYLDENPQLILTHEKEIQGGLDDQIMNEELSTQLRYKMCNFRQTFQHRVKDVENRHSLSKSNSESEFLSLVNSCTTFDEVSRMLDSSIRDCHKDLAVHAITRAIALMSSDEIQDDPPVQADMTLNLLRNTQPVCASMLFFIKDTDVQLCGMNAIASLFSQKDAAVIFGKQSLLGVLNTLIWGHISSSEVCAKWLECCIFLVSRSNENRDAVSNMECFSIIHQILSKHTANRQLFVACCRYICLLSTVSGASRIEMLQAGVSDSLLQCLQSCDCDEVIAESFFLAVKSLCADDIAVQIKLFSSTSSLTLYFDRMKMCAPSMPDAVAFFFRLLAVLAEPGHDFVIDNFFKSNFFRETYSIMQSVQLNVASMLSLLRIVYFMCRSSSPCREEFGSVGITEKLIKYMQAQSNNSDVILASTYAFLGLCDNCTSNLLMVTSDKNIHSLARVLYNNAENGKICKSICAMLVKLSRSGVKEVQLHFSASGIAPELARTLQVKKIDSDSVQAILLLIVHLVNVVNILGPDFIAAGIPSILDGFMNDEWPDKFFNLFKLTKDALIHDDEVKYELINSNNAKTTRIDLLYIHQLCSEGADTTSSLPQGKAGSLLDEIKSRKDVEFVLDKLTHVVNTGDVTLCLKAFKTVMTALESTELKMHMLLARRLIASPSLVAGAMASCLKNLEVQTFGFNIMKLLPYYLEANHNFGGKGECDLIYLVIRCHIDNSSICECGLETAAVLATARFENKKHFGKLDGLRHVRHIIESHHDHPIVLSRCFDFVIAICSGCVDNQATLRDSGFIGYLLNFLKAHQHEEEVVSCCSEALSKLFSLGNTQNNNFIAGTEGFNLYIGILASNVTSVSICTSVSKLIMTITNEVNNDILDSLLQSDSSEVLMKVLLNSSKNGIVTKVIKIFVLLVVYFVCNFSSMRIQFLKDHFVRFLEALKDSPKSNAQISKSIQVALKKLRKLEAKQNLSTALKYIDSRKNDNRKKAAVRVLERRFSSYLWKLNYCEHRAAGDARMRSLAEEMSELSFYHEFHEALSLSVEFVNPKLAADTLRRLHAALWESGEVTSASPLGGSMIQNLDMILQAMSSFLSISDVQVAGIDVLNSLQLEVEEYECFGEKGGFEVLFPLLQRHILNSGICLGILQCTSRWLQDETNRRLCGAEKKQLKVLYKVISVHLVNSSSGDTRDKFLNVMSSFLENLCFNSPINRNKVCEIGVTLQLSMFMLHHGSQELVVSSICSVLQRVCEDDNQKNLHVVMRHDNVLGYVQLIKENISNLKICKHLTGMLIALSGGSDVTLRNELQKSGIGSALAGVLADFRAQAVNPKIEWSLIMLILHLICHVPTMSSEFIAANMVPRLEFYSKGDKTWDPSLQQSADMALRKLRKYSKASTASAIEKTKTPQKDVMVE